MPPATRDWRPATGDWRPATGDLAWAIVAIGAGVVMGWSAPTTAIVLVAGAIFFVAALVRPHLALYALVFSVPYESLRQVEIGGLAVSSTEALTALLLAAWLARVAARLERPRPVPLLIPALILLWAYGLALLQAQNTTLALKEIAKWVETAAVLLVAAHTLTDWRRAAVLLFCLFAAGAAQSGLGAYQFFRREGPESFAFGAYLRAHGTFGQPNALGGYLGLILPLALSAAVLLGPLAWERVKRGAGCGERRARSGERGAGSGERRAGSGERGAGSGERGAESGKREAGSGVTSDPCLPVPRLLSPHELRAPQSMKTARSDDFSRPALQATEVATTNEHYFQVSWAVALAGAAAIPVLGAGLVMSVSRGAWLAFGAAAGAVWSLQGRRALAVLLVLAVIIAVALPMGLLDLLPSFVAARLGSIGESIALFDARHVLVTDENFATVQRMAFWQTALAIWEAHPWVGVGPGNYPVAYPNYYVHPAFPEPLAGHPHNVYLQLLAEVGVVGLAAYLLLWGWALLAALRTLRRLPVSARFWRAVVSGVSGVFVAVLVHTLFDNLYVHGMNVYVGLALGLVAAAGQIPRYASPSPASDSTPSQSGGVPCTM